MCRRSKILMRITARNCTTRCPVIESASCRRTRRKERGKLLSMLQSMTLMTKPNHVEEKGVSAMMMAVWIAFLFTSGAMVWLYKISFLDGVLNRTLSLATFGVIFAVCLACYLFFSRSLGRIFAPLFRMFATPFALPISNFLEMRTPVFSAIGNLTGAVSFGVFCKFFRMVSMPFSLIFGCVGHT